MPSAPSNSYTRTVDDAESFRAALRELWEQCRRINWSGPWRLTFEPHKETRSLAQNRRYWVLVNEWAQQAPQHMDGEWHAPEVWHEFFRQRFLGIEGVPIDGDMVPIIRSTRTLKVDEFAEYMEQVEAWMAEHGLEYLGDL